MKRFCILTVCFLFFFTFIARSEDLGELAKKEKARREELAKQGKKVKTLTNQDVPKIKSSLGIERTQTQTQPQTQPEPSEQAQASEKATTPGEETASSSYDEDLQKLKQEKEAIDREIQEKRGAVGSGSVYRTQNLAQQYEEIKKAEEKSKELDQQIQDLEKKKQEQEEKQQP